MTHVSLFRIFRFFTMIPIIRYMHRSAQSDNSNHALSLYKSYQIVHSERDRKYHCWQMRVHCRLVDTPDLLRPHMVLYNYVFQGHS